LPDKGRQRERHERSGFVTAAVDQYLSCRITETMAVTDETGRISVFDASGTLLRKER